MFYFHENLPTEVINPPAVMRAMVEPQPLAGVQPPAMPVIHEAKDKSVPPVPFSVEMQKQVSGNYTGPVVPLLRHVAHILHWKWGGIHCDNQPPLIVTIFTYRGETVHAMLSSVAAQLPAQDNVNLRFTHGTKSAPTLSIGG
ncbi:DotD/TraH family lipoprotein [Acidithiobacillus caldus]|uniref:DotD/TraH family lipoprotein n=1 Tax=Acidithiobacillus caldus TaxID=33059 RepID=UPI001C07170F|nr:hypothetical protein [Acidithiobacillus caldus]MBU2770121.1 hypothetical protein [Acidithiobacillus caldus]